MRVLVNKVWPLTLSVIAFLAANVDAIYELATLELSKAGNAFNWQSFLFIAMGLLTMVKTYSEDTARKLALSAPHELKT